MFRRTLVLCVLMIWKLQWVTRSNGATLNDANNLHANLTSGYNKIVRPVNNQSDAVEVDITLYLIALQEVDEVLERFSFVGAFKTTWKDDKLVWNPSDYGGITSVMMNYEDVWVPEISILNPSEKLDSFGKDWQDIRYHFNGTSIWWPGDYIKVACTFNVYYFPYDVQTCSVNVYIWGYNAFEVLLTANSSTVVLGQTENPSWKIQSTHATVEIDQTNVSRGKFSFTLKRKPAYVIINVFVPILFLCLLNILVFLLPAESGERISYSITVMLAIAVYMTIVSSTLPKSSDPVPLVSYLILVCLALSALITFITVMNLRLYHRSDKDVPALLVSAYKRLSCSRPQSEQDPKGIQNDAEDKNRVLPFVTDTKVKSVSSNGANGNERKGNKPQKVDNQKSKPEDIEDVITWMDISIIVDYIAVIVSTSLLVLAYLIFSIVTQVGV